MGATGQKENKFRIRNSYYSSQKSNFLPSFGFEKTMLSLVLLPLSPTIVTNATIESYEF